MPMTPQQALPAFFICAVCALAAGTGCGGSAVRRDAPPDAAKSAVEDPAGGDGDGELTKRIRQSLMSDERLSLAAKHITIITRDGRTTLSGTVPTPRDKAEAGTRTRAIVGIERVDNEIVIAPGSAPGG